MINEDSNLGIETLLKRSATECRNIAVITTQIEELIFTWASEIAPESRPPLAFHQIDLLIQTANELANFLEDLSAIPKTKNVNGISEAILRIKIASLRNSLGDGMIQSETDSLDRSKTERIEFF